MRATLRLFARVKAGKYLENFAPTGLTGLTTHPSPRPTLIYLYTSTLEKLKQIPESSVYRQSTEALTRQRLNIVDAVKPAGFDAWLQKAQAVVAENPEAFRSARRPDGSYAALQKVEVENPDGKDFDGETYPEQTEGAYLNEEEMRARINLIQEEIRQKNETQVKWDPEPPLEASQYVFLKLRPLSWDGLTITYRIAEIENQIGAGLIEEVIQVAQDELKLVDEMVKHKVYV